MELTPLKIAWIWFVKDNGRRTKVSASSRAWKWWNKHGKSRPWNVSVHLRQNRQKQVNKINNESNGYDNTNEKGAARLSIVVLSPNHPQPEPTAFPTTFKGSRRPLLLLLYPTTTCQKGAPNEGLRCHSPGLSRLLIYDRGRFRPVCFRKRLLVPKTDRIAPR